jgi:hypothetical protein
MGTPAAVRTTERRPGFWRSAGAVLLGFVVVVILSLGTDEVLHLTGVYPPWGKAMSDGLFGLATVYRIIYGIIGAYVTARFAPNRPMQHAIAGAVLGIVLTAIATVATWNRGPEFGPHWYPLTLIATSLPCAWVGGKMRVRQLQNSN